MTVKGVPAVAVLGAVTVKVFRSVTGTVALVVVLPAASVATACSEYEPSARPAVGHDVLQLDPDGVVLPMVVQAPDPARYWTTTLATPDPVSAAVPETVTVPPWTELPAGEVTATVGGLRSIWTASDLKASVLPAVSLEKYRTVADEDTVKGPVYRVEDVVGVLPSVVYQVPATPLASEAERVTTTSVELHPAAFGRGDWDAVVTGGVVSPLGTATEVVAGTGDSQADPASTAYTA